MNDGNKRMDRMGVWTVWSTFICAAWSVFIQSARGSANRPTRTAVDHQNKIGSNAFKKPMGKKRRGVPALSQDLWSLNKNNNNEKKVVGLAQKRRKGTNRPTKKAPDSVQAEKGKD